MPVPPELAAELRGAATLAGTWTAERNRLIVEARDAGASLREIAEHAGISHVAVKKILDR